MIEEHFNQLNNSPIVFDTKEYNLKDLDLLARLDLLIGLSAAKRLHVPLLLSLVLDTGMSWENFFSQYVNKNISNVCFVSINPFCSLWLLKKSRTGLISIHC